MTRQIPVTVIGGYLGAGKTTLLNRLLAEAQNVKLAVLVNDFGSVNIDAALISSRDGETINLANGCVCCSIGDNLGLALHDLAERPDGPDRILIEASGVADPAKISHYAESHPRLALDSIVVVADAETVRARADDKYVGDLVRLQLAAADAIVLSRTDIVDAETCRAVRTWIETEIPGARLAASHDLDHGQMFVTRTFESELPLDGAALRAALAALPADVVRAKGIVRLIEAPDRHSVLQFAGRRWSLEPDTAEVGPLERNRSVIVCIGLAGSIDLARLDACFAGVLPSALPAALIDELHQGALRS
ncbi:GTPase, G3E family [Enhydrobacter aerosaccus]|uniref:GTPase, G3E family n=1 Tax=Enhydrobacter aerosaccus TaxID=225324 RepID=A0A1T4SL87_9HYPH|nr:GTP-binding protein [Enhydrobacter aerosaccus]SKA28945.1 GTPase, G3E family [Enhydrobacter aerosaccus]